MVQLERYYTFDFGPFSFMRDSGGWGFAIKRVLLVTTWTGELKILLFNRQ